LDGLDVIVENVDRWAAELGGRADATDRDVEYSAKSARDAKNAFHVVLIYPEIPTCLVPQRAAARRGVIKS
jgi:hypothetical protein